MMEYQKIINLLENTSNQPTNLRTKNWVEINDESCGTDNVNRKIKIKTLMLRSSLCNYSDAYILVSAITRVINTAAQDTEANKRKNIIIKNCSSFISCVGEMNNTQIDNAK